MCGLTGFFGGNWESADGVVSALRGMARSIHHRGPDNSGVWIDQESRVAFAHNRLAILDLSPAGEQPMLSVSGRFVIVYNGEIYNHMELRGRLASEGAPISWRGHSDTETLLASIEAWGVQTALERSTGMFAFALWDRREKQLVLARDRLGEKPLYYGWQGSGEGAMFLFGSELKALCRNKAFAAEIDRESLALYTQYGYVPEPRSIYKGVKKLVPGSFLTVSERDREGVLKVYWSGAQVARSGAATPHSGAVTETLDELEVVLKKAVGAQMLSDVPVGAFLSGGVDSSAIAAMMQSQSSQPIKTFCIGFEEAAYNEAQYAKSVAKHLGTDHTELYVTAEDAMGIIPELPTIYDEPFADSSQIPMILVSKMASRAVTVALSGDGGDELFGGYNRYKISKALWQKISKVPRPIRRAAAAALTSVSASKWDALASFIDPVVPKSMRLALPGEKIHKGASVLASSSADHLYLGLVSQWDEEADLVIGSRRSNPGATNDLAGLSDVERMMTMDMLTYLPGDILTKVDRAAMSVSLETRVPFLDHEVVEFAWRLPMEMKIRNGETKWALRQLLYRHVPRQLIERPKMGFGVPIDSWLRGPLKDWGEALLAEDRLQSEGFLNVQAVRRAWSAHQAGGKLQHKLWTLLMFQSWLDAREEAWGTAAIGLQANG